MPNKLFEPTCEDARGSTMALNVMCPTCEAPDRLIWTFGNLPKLDKVREGTWITLESCPLCSALWCSVPHEPYGGYIFIAAWPYDTATFERLNARDNARILHEWHDAVVRENWMRLSPEEGAWIEQWRDRTYRQYNLIDRGSGMKAPELIHQASEIERYAHDI